MSDLPWADGEMWVYRCHGPVEPGPPFGECELVRDHAGPHMDREDERKQKRRAVRIEALADRLMDLRMDGPAAEGWTYQQTMRHYAERILEETE